MNAEDPPNPETALPLTFDEARQAQLREFAKTTPQQRLDWLGEMLELMQAIQASRAKGGEVEASTPDVRDRAG